MLTKWLTEREIAISIDRINSWSVDDFIYDSYNIYLHSIHSGVNLNDSIHNSKPLNGQQTWTWCYDQYQQSDSLIFDILHSSCSGFDTSWVIFITHHTSKMNEEPIFSVNGTSWSWVDIVLYNIVLYNICKERNVFML